MTSVSFDLDDSTRERLWRTTAEIIERYFREVETLRVAPRLNPEGLRASLRVYDFEEPIPPEAALEIAAAGLSENQVHTAHPSYFGLFNPAPTAMGVAADALVAAFNPQLAAWSHNPFGAEVERRLIDFFAGLFGYEPSERDGTLTTGGAEANHTAILAAFFARFPEAARSGVRALSSPPVFYASAESHHSLLKAARVCGLGEDALRIVPADGRLRMDAGRLSEMISQDRAAGREPFLIVATAGTTSAGAIDPIEEISGIARREKLWMHVDAAWGGAVVFLRDMRGVLAGIEQADSISFDAHKWLSVPMGAGFFLTRRNGALDRAFSTAAGYMPKEAKGLRIVDPFSHSLQWSRRFIGLKVFLSLAVAGRDGYESAIRHQIEMGDLARARLTRSGWTIVNETELPLVCFTDASEEMRDREFIDRLVARVVDSGRAWISAVRLGPESRPAARMCITSYRTGPKHIEELVDLIGQIRTELRAASPR